MGPFVTLVVPAMSAAAYLVFAGMDHLVTALAAAMAFAALTCGLALVLLRACTYELLITHDAGARTVEVARSAWGRTRRHRIHLDDVTAWYYLQPLQTLVVDRRRARPLRLVLHVPSTSRTHGGSARAINRWLTEGPLGELHDGEHEAVANHRTRRRLHTAFFLGVPLAGAALAGVLLLIVSAQR